MKYLIVLAAATALAGCSKPAEQEPAAQAPEAAATQPAQVMAADGQPAQPGQSGSRDDSGSDGDAQEAGAGGTQPDTGAPAEPSEPGQGAVTEGDLGDAAERRQALEQWLRQIPDDPAELLRRKFWYEQQQRQDSSR